MNKGFHGEPLREAIRSIVQPGKVLSFSEIVIEIKKKGAWKDDSIYQTLMAHVRNLVPAKYRWHAREQFLFLRANGRYELYNPEIHPKVVE
jgi:hypothetical protein